MGVTQASPQLASKYVYGLGYLRFNLREVKEEFITAKQVSERLHISRPTLSRIKSEIGFYRIGGKIKFTEENLSLYLERVKQPPVNLNSETRKEK